MQNQQFKAVLTFCLFFVSGFASTNVHACGGFFCSFFPINQAQEQIVFRQDGKNITTMVQIAYQGEAEDFAWVLPVPGIPEVTLGNNTIFPILERATRPQFNLDVTGEVCESDLNRREIDGSFLPTPTSSTPGSSSSGGVQVVETKEVGPFVIDVVKSEDPKAMSEWLTNNNYDISSRGEELITPYVEDGMNFLAVKLKSGSTTGDVQPLILKYESEKPMIPIKLTAVAAEDDMGIIVWLLGDARAVPENFLSVEPNYTQINWWNGTQGGYQSYQTLITDAMNEAGGQGFATDYAGKDIDIFALLPETLQIQNFLDDAQGFSARVFLQDLASQNILPVDQLVGLYKTYLPKDDGSDADLLALYLEGFVYDGYNDAELDAARMAIVADIQTRVVDGYVEGKKLFEGDKYLTRMYTTLSADEMTVDPIFVFNNQMQDQALMRSATLNMMCTGATTEWNLELGEGTGRAGEKVMNGTGLPPTFFGRPLPPIPQENLFRSASTSQADEPELVTLNTFEPVRFRSNGNEIVLDSSDGSKSSASAMPAYTVYLFLLLNFVVLMKKCRIAPFIHS